VPSRRWRAIRFTSRARASIAVDGHRGDEGWRGATKIEKWYEVNPGDNPEPKVRNVGYLVLGIGDDDRRARLDAQGVAS